ncbi:MAG: ParA family protein [Cetobacterium sp.]
MILMLKNNKGGVGKSWLTFNIGHGLSMLGNKVLIITSDSQNNVLDFSGVKEEPTTGLEDWVVKGEGNVIRLREDLYYIPLLNNNFSSVFRKKVKKTIEKLKKEYDYILIDSVPTLQIDNEFMEISDKILVPIYLDDVSIKGTVKMVINASKEKMLGIIPNRFNDSKMERGCYMELKQIMENSDIQLFEPLKQMKFITELISKNKSIWESNSNVIAEVHKVFCEILKVIIKCKKER